MPFKIRIFFSLVILFFSSFFYLLAKDQQKELVDVKKLLASNEKEILNYQKEYKKLIKNLKSIDIDVAKTSLNIDKINQEILQKKKKNNKLSTSINQQQKEIEKIKAQLKQNIIDLYLIKENTPLDLIFSKENYFELNILETYNNELLAKNESLISKLNKANLQAKALQKNLNKQLKSLNNQLLDKQQKQKELDNYSNLRNKNINSLKLHLANAKTKRASLEENEEILNKLIQKQKLKKRNTNIYSQKGKLKFPVKGKIVKRFNQAKSADIRYKGVVIAAPSGTQVKAIASGKVLIASWVKGQGMLVIIDHGMSVMSIYGYNQALHVKKGQQVQKGEAIALSGKNYTNQFSGLYFEIRQKAQAVNPTSWCK